ncbi:tRNA (guanosine(46)-N7)-methyltransferase TrmB [Dysgonomonas sp. GY617]|uniref:tRNA (guanosine(46)-N7)-methyltransferase TrmB n=1 Tax=Dysgonomonas sp. GY617 TaxID=2780420 RepID=UPI0018840F4F|nr:tRNA (guanosine(46)-N7)-methyltransferase TrmB [Dysgonomonas sp. GY617]MBF0576067.1 tRNA (guanosine(46)-N7)-methyltransferase TrmB [Dysgonomonas sp. GY617]
MGKNKLAKFANMNEYPHVFQYPFAVLKEKGFEMKGKWNEMFFKNNNPIILELGCGKGEYSVGLAKLYPENNFIGVDIKGARMWSGAKQSFEEKLENVAFLRTHIELLSNFFDEGEVSEIWITFPDPQMNKVNRRMTSTRFMKLYAQFLKPNGVVHLKSDSNFMFTYTSEMVDLNNLKVLFKTDDLYHSDLVDDILSIKTFYEQQWIARGLNIKYLKFEYFPKEDWVEPEVEIEQDSYRSYGRSNSQILTKRI